MWYIRWRRWRWRWRWPFSFLDCSLSCVLSIYQSRKQDSLGGNTKTVMVANIGPADYNYDETISTLRYANRAKNIKNKPRINEDPKDTMLREFQEEIARLKQQLASSQGMAGAAAMARGELESFDPNSKELRMSQVELSSIKKKIQEELMADMRASISDDVSLKVRSQSCL